MGNGEEEWVRGCRKRKERERKRGGKEEKIIGVEEIREGVVGTEDKEGLAWTHGKGVSLGLWKNREGKGSKKRFWGCSKGSRSELKREIM